MYDDVELPYPDAKVAEKLCDGGACFYLPNPRYDPTMMNAFILRHVVPNVRKRLPESACIVLGRALMWLIFSPVVDDYIPTEMMETVTSEWAHVRGDIEEDDEQEINPIIQTAVTVSGDHGAVFIDTIADVGEGVVAAGVGTNVSLRNQLVGVQWCLLSMRQENLELRNAINTSKVNTERNLQMINGNIRRLAIRPVGVQMRNAAATTVVATQQPVPLQQDAAGGGHAMMTPATLMPTPGVFMTSGWSISTGWWEKSCKAFLLF